MSQSAGQLGVKERELGSWTLVAPGWRKWDEVFTRSTAALSARMAELAGALRGRRVLDVASGTGEPALELARRVGPEGAVLGTDLVEPMLAFAREKATAAHLFNVEFRRVDGEALDERPASFSAATIRWGLMFMPDPIACLRRCFAALEPGGRVVVACWAEPERNPWAAVTAGIIRRHLGTPPPPPGTPGIFAFADSRRLLGALSEAGFTAATLEEVPVSWGPFGSVDATVAFITEVGGPVASALAAMTPEQSEAVLAELRAALAGFHRGSTVVVPGVTWVAAARRPE